MDFMWSAPPRAGFAPVANERVSQTATVISTTVVAVPSASGVISSANGAITASNPSPTRCESG